MTLPATESFTDSNGVQLTTHSASWTLNSGDFDIQSNAVCIDDADNQLARAAHWNADSFNDDQWAELVIAALETGNYHYLGPAVRCAESANTFYLWMIPGEKVAAAATEYMIKVVAGSENTLVSNGGSATFSVGNTLRLEAEGENLTPYRNGSTTGTCGMQTDSGIASGSAGLGGWDANFGTRTNVRMDDWEGGNLVESGPTLEIAIVPTDSNYDVASPIIVG